MFEMDVCFFGGYDFHYPRNSVLRWGLSANGVSVTQVHAQRGSRFWLRYPLLLLRFLRHCRTSKSEAPDSFLLVPEFCQKDVPLARALAWISSRNLIFDPLASRFETKILDWRWRSEDSLPAWWNRTLDRLAFQLADLVLADTEAHKGYYYREFGLPKEKIEVLPVGFDDRIFTASLAEYVATARARLETSPFTVMFFGSFLPLHGVEVTIRAAHRVWKEDRTIRFALVGSGQTWLRARKLATELGLINVSFEGWLDQLNLAQKIAREADLVLGIFGRTEKATRVVPHKVFQAMALRKPVVTAATPACQEFFTHRQNIYFSPAGDADSLARAILELRADRSLGEEIAVGGYELVRDRFTPKALGLRLQDILARHFPARSSSSSLPPFSFRK